MIAIPWLVLWLPFFAALLISLFLLKNPKAAGIAATGTLLVSFALSVVLFVTAKSPFESSIAWIPLEGLPIEFGVLVNPLSLLMLLIVTGIGSLIFLYSMAYMKDDESYGRYFASLSLFAFSMLGIVLSNNLIQIFVFWELVGLSSYLLIGFWFQKPEASTAGKKAFLTTRVGDVGMMIGILMLFGFLKQNGQSTFNFLQLEQVPLVLIPAHAMTAIALLIFLGIAGKSAQVPLHVWLPDAMEGPTPVSALIHAATMVAAGVFLLTRIYFIFAASASALMIIAWTGAITAFLAATIAVVQNDIKKILAYSTLSQLGYMVLALGLHNPGAGMFHLTTHAFFKALLFLGSGSLIHALHTQDIWEMSSSSSPLPQKVTVTKKGDSHLLHSPLPGGERARVRGGLLKSMPITGWTFLIGTLALMGIPPLSGFFSKEAVLSATEHGPAPLFWLAITVVFLTAFYMGRLCTIVFFKSSSHSASVIPAKAGIHLNPSAHHAHESGWQMALPLLILAALSIGGGFLPLPEFLGFPLEHGENKIIAILSVGLAVGGFALAFFIFRNATVGAGLAPARSGHPQGVPLHSILENKYFFDKFYDKVVIQGIQEKLGAASDWFERIIVVEGGVNGTARFTAAAGNLLRKLQTGVVQFYALVFSAGLTLLVYGLILWKK